MATVSAELLETIIELQGLSSLKNAVLGGGTNLAIRYDHRTSTDIDLFFSGIIGKSGYKEIENEIQAYFSGNASRLDYPCDESDQYMFMRFWVKKRELTVYFGETDHMIPWQTDHLICWRRIDANAIEALTKVVI